ncbi:single-stranded DNA-binding protein [Euzebya sp.]|uniref:single-stranded DNA-binding protein n=1 Tax=Euzebya sp. TaxID=1971409 RepID=UPI003516B250
MSSHNQITIAGNLTADPDLRTTSGEVPRSRLRVAVNRRVKVAGTQDEWEDRLDGFFTVVCWRDMAVHVRACLRKGDRVVVTGHLTGREYEVTTDGGTETRHATEIVAEEVGGSFRWYPWTRMEPRPLLVDAGDASVPAPDDDDAPAERVVAPAA